MRYLRLLIIFYKNAILTDLEYRVNFLANMGMSAFWIGFALLSVQVFFQHRSRIGDWSYYEVMLVIGLFSLFNGVMEALLRPNLSHVVEAIRLGTFDFVLTKPVDSQFLASLRYLTLWRLADVGLGAGIVLYALVQLGEVVSPLSVLLFGALLAAAAMILYSIWILMMTMSFWFVQIDNLSELFSSLFEAGRWPVTVYPGWVRGLLTFVIPVAFITTFPAAALMNRLEPRFAGYAILMAAALFLASRLFWRYAVNHYSSASS